MKTLTCITPYEKLKNSPTRRCAGRCAWCPARYCAKRVNGLKYGMKGAQNETSGGVGTERGGGSAALVPSLPGCISEGDTREEALRNIEEAIRLYLEPVDDDSSLAANAEVVEIAV